MKTQIKSIYKYSLLVAVSQVLSSSSVRPLGYALLANSESVQPSIHGDIPLLNPPASGVRDLLAVAASRGDTYQRLPTGDVIGSNTTEPRSFSTFWQDNAKFLTAGSGLAAGGGAAAAAYAVLQTFQPLTAPNVSFEEVNAFCAACVAFFSLAGITAAAAHQCWSQFGKDPVTVPKSIQNVIAVLTGAGSGREAVRIFNEYVIQPHTEVMPAQDLAKLGFCISLVVYCAYHCLNQVKFAQVEGTELPAQPQTLGTSSRLQGATLPLSPLEAERARLLENSRLFLHHLVNTVQQRPDGEQRPGGEMDIV